MDDWRNRAAWRPRIFFSSGVHAGLPQNFPMGNSIRRARHPVANGHGHTGRGLYTQMHHRQIQGGDCA
ncbi:hypothetical protein RSOLAG1IB_03922 [Rhizoctonia solani AG-1 IB]|uniref:Uncharacterized protein n=1 Tax=Thanatephorus cucumeris (strain AG1-IB / isolate 7/3/14) TaxID=1108050 RepID=A0A0B7FUZ5_THACB|nr:hypothetical protein RSOLAG1IB_03922 [Rhizoctonia solani AG-1 IB]